MSSKLFHAVAAAHFLFGLYYDVTYVEIPQGNIVRIPNDPVPLKGRLKFLTIWNVISCALYFTIALLDDFVTTKDILRHKSFIRKVKELHFSCIAFPITLLVTSFFWILYNIDREMIFPKAFDSFFPVWLNHLYHTNILLFMLAELFINFIDYPARKTGLTAVTFFLLTYCLWMNYMYYMSGRWVYPVMELMNWPIRIVFYISNLFIVFGCYIVGEKLTEFMWPKLTSQKKNLAKKYK